MINIVVINCDDKYVEYEWNSIRDFLDTIDGEGEDIPMLDDALAEVNTDNTTLEDWWKNDFYSTTVYDLYSICKNLEESNG